MNAAIKRKSLDEVNATKLSSLIWEQCSTSLQGQLKQRIYYVNVIYNDPVKLVLAIKDQTKNYQDMKYAMEIIDNSLTDFLLLKGKDGELHEYTRRFKIAKQVLDSLMGGLVKLVKYVSQLPTFNVLDDEKRKSKKFSAYKLLKKANTEKFGKGNTTCQRM